MAETSLPWGGQVLGDAGPYDDDDWSDMFRDAKTARFGDMGVKSDLLNELTVTISAAGPPGTIQIDTGGAYVNGKWYLNDAVISKVQPAGAAGSYLAVLQKTWATQEVRAATRIGAGLTQNDGVLWEIPLASYTLAADGTISALVDLRMYINPLVSTHIADGRLTLLTGDPAPDSDATAQSTIFYTPYVGNRISLQTISGARWVTAIFSEISVAVPNTTVTPFDVFAFLTNGNVSIETLDWTNDTTRATALVYEGGVLVKNGDGTRRYLGTGRTTGVAGECEDSLLNRFVWNYYNRINRMFEVEDLVNTHQYGTATIRSWNNDVALRVNLLIGVQEEPIDIAFREATNSLAAGREGQIGFGLDSTVAFENGLYVTRTELENAYNGFAETLFVGLGFHFLQTLQNAPDAANIQFIKVRLAGTLRG